MKTFNYFTSTLYRVLEVIAIMLVWVVNVNVHEFPCHNCNADFILHGLHNV